MVSFKTLSNRTDLFHKGIISAKRIIYGTRGEPIRYGQHRLRYLPGTRPVRLKYVNSLDDVTRNDARQLTFFIDNVKTGNFVLDIGGHFGQYAVLFASLVSESGRVITFEPDPLALRILNQNVNLNGFADRIEIETVALFDKTGTHSFFSKGGDSMSSLAKSGLGSNSQSLDVSQYDVKTERLDDYLRRRNYGWPDVVKLDTEGAEINILRGAGELLRSGSTIVCELHPYAWEEFQTSFEELLQLIRECGRTISYLDPSVRIEDGAFYGAVIIR